MLLLDREDPVRKNLDKLYPLIAEIASRCIQIYFGKVCTVDDDWCIIDRLKGNYPHNICLGCGSEQYQAISVLGVGASEIGECIGTQNTKEAFDAFGEMLNVYFGMLMDEIEFTDCFGVLTQSLAQYSADSNYYPKAWGCNGSLITPAGGTIYMGFAIRSNK